MFSFLHRNHGYFFLFFIYFLFFPACSIGEEPEVEDTRYYGEAFSLQPGSSWIPVEKGEFSSNIPKETIAAFTAPNQNNELLKTCTIVTEDLSIEVADPIAYANANIGEAMKSVVNYEKIVIEEKEMSGIKTKIHIFKGKLHREDDMFQFTQTYLVKNQKGYILTGVLLENAEQSERDEVVNMMMSFQFNDAVKENN